MERFTEGAEGLPDLVKLLQAYAEGLVPWAERVAARMIAEVNDRERDAWRALGSAISAQLHSDLRTAPVAAKMQELRDVQVELITSIPLKAAERVSELTLKALESSTRAREIAKEIARTTEVTQARATLIARTETSRTASTLLHARCEAIGSIFYVWRTSRDSDVRPGHRAMEGKVCEWANPPAVNEGGRILYHHPGEVWNCRCFAEPLLSDPYAAQRRNRG